jgi:hypothetical protein
VRRFATLCALVGLAASCNGSGGAPASGSHAPLPIVDYLGGPVVGTPKVVTVTYDGDSQRDLLESFDDDITQTGWWDAVRAGYCDGGTPKTCVGRGSSGGHVHLADAPPAALDDGPTGGSLRTLLQGYFTSGALPPPERDLIYVVHLPASSTVLVDGWAPSCRIFTGYHASFDTPLPGGGTTTVLYVVIPSCAGSGDADLTSTASHELIETATDPVDPDPALGGTAYSMTTDTVWPLVAGSEVADLCSWPNDHKQYVEGPYFVVRSWSNVAAAAGRDPCVPTDPASAPYFAVAPVADALTMPVGTSTTLELDAFAEGKRADWDVSVLDVSDAIGGTAGAVTATLDAMTANTGAKLHLSIDAKAIAPADHPALLLIVSSDGTTSNRWPLAITVQ